MTTDIDHDDTFDFDAGDEIETDEIALPRFEERLRARLAEAHHEHIVAPARSGDRPPARLHERRARRSLTVGVGAIAAAAALVVGVVARQSGDDTTAGDASGISVPPTSELAPLVIAATDEAAATTVVHVSQDNDSYGDDESWTDETTGASRLLQYGDDGEPIFDSSQTADATLTVDHCFSEYAEGVPGLPVSAGSATQWVQNYLAEGWMVEDGTQVVDGRELIRLREVPVDEIDPDSGLGQRIEARNEAGVEVPGDDGGSSTPPSTEGDPEMRDPEEALDAAQTAAADAAQSEDDEDQSVALVDPETYRPVQLIGPGHSYVQTYEYLPRTPGNLALLEAQVPEGFTEVPNVRGDGERADIGCH